MDVRIVFQIKKDILNLMKLFYVLMKLKPILHLLKIV